METHFLSPEDIALLSEQEQSAYEELLRRQLALSSPMEYGVYASKMQRYPHVEYVDSLIMAALHGRLYKTGVGPRCVFEPDPFQPDDPYEGKWVHPVTGEPALFNIALSEPPRHGKSFHVSQHFPAWFRTKFPTLNFHLASYEATFAASWGAKARDLVKAHPELGVAVRDDAGANALWKLKGYPNAEMKTAGAGGGITGSGRHVGVIDDLVKNAEEAMSEVTRSGNIEWYISTWKTRREPHPARMLMLNPGHVATYPDIFCIDISMSTRWHEDDLNGWLRENEPEEWYFVNLPALAYDDPQSPDYGDPKRCVLGRQPGEPLCPSRFNRTDLLKIKGSERGLFWFNAMYQGTPRVEDGGLIQKPFRYYRTQPSSTGGTEYVLDDGERVAEHRCLRFATMDLAATMKTRSDYTVFQVWDVTPAPQRRMILRAQYRVKIESPDHVGYTLQWFKEFRPAYILIEDRTYGSSLLQQMRRDYPAVPVRPLSPDKDKYTRAIPFASKILAGDVFFPADAPWLPAFETELLLFPNVQHDDQVDCAAYAARELDRIPKLLRNEWEAPTTLEERAVEHIEKIMKKKDAERRRRVRSVRRR